MTFYSNLRGRERRAPEVLSAEIFDTADCGTGLVQLPRPAEAEALDNLSQSGPMRALRDLPDNFKVAIYLADIEGYRYAEIARITGVPLGTVMSRIHRARAMLRKNLHPHPPRPRQAS